MKQIEAELQIKQRVLDVIKERKISVNKLALSVGASQTTINDQVNGRSKLSAATLVALAAFSPDISAEWLLRGIGDMLLASDQLQSNVEPNTTTRRKRDGNETETSADLYERIIEEKDARIKVQEDTIADLRERIAELKGDIATPRRSAATA